MRSSPAFAASSLEVPPSTVAELIAGVASVVAPVFVAWACARQGQLAMAVLAGLLGGLLAGRQAVARRRAGAGPARRLEVRVDGSVWLHVGGDGPCPLATGPGTRLLGPSVFLDLCPVAAGSAARLRLWITPLDAPRDELRRLGILLTGHGPGSRS